MDIDRTTNITYIDSPIPEEIYDTDDNTVSSYSLFFGLLALASVNITQPSLTLIIDKARDSQYLRASPLFCALDAAITITALCYCIFYRRLNIVNSARAVILFRCLTNEERTDRVAMEKAIETAVGGKLSWDGSLVRALALLAALSQLVKFMGMSGVSVEIAMAWGYTVCAGLWELLPVVAGLGGKRWWMMESIDSQAVIPAGERNKSRLETVERVADDLRHILTSGEMLLSITEISIWCVQMMPAMTLALWGLLRHILRDDTPVEYWRDLVNELIDDVDLFSLCFLPLVLGSTLMVPYMTLKFGVGLSYDREAQSSLRLREGKDTMTYTRLSKAAATFLLHLFSSGASWTVIMVYMESSYEVMVFPRTLHDFMLSSVMWAFGFIFVAIMLIFYPSYSNVRLRAARGRVFVLVTLISAVVYYFSLYDESKTARAAWTEKLG